MGKVTLPRTVGSRRFEQVYSPGASEVGSSQNKPFLLKGGLKRMKHKIGHTERYLHTYSLYCSFFFPC
jgi:hypothetical protein